MYEYIKGNLIEKSPAEAVIDCNGVAYFINISLQTFSRIKEKGDVKLYIHLVVKEDSHTLYGFAQKSERNLFRLLISVSGVGANTARVILSGMSTDETANAIVTENVDALKSVKGIGAKTAQRIILDLKDKVVKEDSSSELFTDSHNTNKEEALSALIMLGFAKKAAEKALTKIIKKEGLSASVEDLVRFALKIL
ncbi:MAG: Holliday junction branch migration protein RuvA [Bacteroidetes bacterium]|nr:MAG: Holliday junction branch migration protein RuvA [Bacteroidota bacterium]RLD63680.1 MAG: Holliday junction branch migration protein RuvA [Bacteroidota bacterium]